MPPGGARQGTPGQTYQNRTDLNAQPVRAAGGQPYGARGQQEAAQRAVPVPQERAMPTPLGAPSQRPSEDISHGMPFGPGPSSPAMMLPPQQTDKTGDMIRALYMAWPDEGLRQLLERYEDTGQ